MISRDGVYRNSQILETRENREAPEEGELLRSTQIHYYVHYIGLNRRLDEWVDASGIDTLQVCIADKNFENDFAQISHDDPFFKGMISTDFSYSEFFVLMWKL